MTKTQNQPYLYNQLRYSPAIWYADALCISTKHITRRRRYFHLIFLSLQSYASDWQQKHKKRTYLDYQLRYLLEILYAGALGISTAHTKQEDIILSLFLEAAIKCLRLIGKTPKWTYLHNQLRYSPEIWYSAALGISTTYISSRRRFS